MICDLISAPCAVLIGEFFSLLMISLFASLKRNHVIILFVIVNKLKRLFIIFPFLLPCGNGIFLCYVRPVSRFLRVF